MIEVLPRTSDLLVELNKAVRRHGDGCLSRLALVLCRYDPTTGTLRTSGAVSVVATEFGAPGVGAPLLGSQF